MTVHAHNLGLGYTQTLGASSVLELRVGVNRFSALRPSNGLGFKITTLGLPASAEQYLQQSDVDEFPGIATQGYSLLGNNNGPYYESHLEQNPHTMALVPQAPAESEPDSI